MRLVITHTRKLVRTYLVCIFPRKVLSIWCKTILFLNSKIDIPDERNALNRTDNTPCQKLATKINGFQSAFEVKDLATNGTCRQVTLLPQIDALSSRCLLYLTVCWEDSTQPAYLKTYYLIRLCRHVSDLPLIIRLAEQY